jgi:murein peptide amidase A
MRNRLIKYIYLLIACMVLFIGGCYKAQVATVLKRPPAHSDRPPLESSAPEGVYHAAGFSVENRPIEYFEIGDGEDVTVIIAAIHGNEQDGMLIARRLIHYLQDNRHLLKNRKVVILPEVNPDGIAANTRCNARGVDLNRNFFTENRINNDLFGMAAFSEPETRVIDQILREYVPDRIISIHEPLACVDYDGPGGEELAAHIANYCGLPLKKLGARPGSLGSYTEENLNIPIVTLELPENAGEPDSERLWFFYGSAIIASVIYPDDAGDCFFQTEKKEKDLSQEQGYGK